ncbi:predicted protein [Thalassiosira pseudonana CCMP1335]|uniref:Uncharacterized protein n=1 Tax=Thalassiosira pseudonana TaxID=35128 RepID=B8LDC0_THAPS|nr:predicted protein [Thalassiosira pseudonana CCMP1335]EED86686.1 predicted protein [Thalassiosira pseudonana CCMP1335]|eukprot:scaffold4733_cov170-Alexandrium_tamarense.AAC.58
MKQPQTSKPRRRKRQLGIHLLLTVAVVTASLASASDEHEGKGNDNGRIVQSLFRFPASRFGPEFEDLLKLFHGEWLHVNDTTSSLPPITPDPTGTTHASRAVSGSVPTLFRRQCYGPTSVSSMQQQMLYKNLEQRKKDIEFQYLKDSSEETRLLFNMVKRFAPAFLPDGGEGGNRSSHSSGGTTKIHKKRAKSTVNTVYSLPSSVVAEYELPSTLSFQTNSHDADSNNNNNSQPQQWTWRPPAHFSSRGTPKNMTFRYKFFESMRQQFQQSIQRLLPTFELEMGRHSGMFWYPPGGVREWHCNYLDVQGAAGGKNGDKRDEAIFNSQVWRMYFVRTVRDAEFDDKLSKLRMKVSGDGTVDRGSNDHSAMHIIPGGDEGTTLEVLQKAGARPLTQDEKQRQWSDIFAEEDPIPQQKDDSVDSKEDDEFDRNAVWRVPDQDGHVTIFRIPDLWHCIVSEEVHRYSLGFAFSDSEVQSLLKVAGVEFDVSGYESNTKRQDGTGDEL